MNITRKTLVGEMTSHFYLFGGQDAKGNDKTGFFNV